MQRAVRRLSILLRRAGQGLDREAHRRGGLYGSSVSKTLDGARVGCFVGFVTGANSWGSRAADPPEAAVFAFVDPPDSRLARRLVTRRGGLFSRVLDEARRQGNEFEFHPTESAALIRHRSVRGMPPEILTLTSQDFFSTALRVFWVTDFFTRLRRLRSPRSPRRV